MQTIEEIDLQSGSSMWTQSVQNLVTLLALVGTRAMDGETLREKTKLSPPAFKMSLQWLQSEYLVDVVSSLDGDRVSERVILNDRGERLLIRILERTCELPDLS